MSQSWSFKGATSAELIARARRGDRSALSALFEKHVPILRRWAHGRLPRWARAFGDTTDLVQEAALNTFKRLDRFEPKGAGALQGYLRRAVQNRITDILRRSETRSTHSDSDGEVLNLWQDQQPSPLEQTISLEEQARYRQALSRLSPADQVLVVGRIELGYSYEQLAVASGRATPEAARVALRRAVARLVQEMTRA